MLTKAQSFWLIILLGVTFSAPVHAQTTDIAVVVNEKNPITNLRSSELRQIFAGEKHSWAGNVPIRLFIRDRGTPERNAVLKLLRMTESGYKEYWTAQVFRGENQAEPFVLPSNGMQKEAIVTYPAP
jgi:ABC-type phosphate transport system substrate-binding protein